MTDRRPARAPRPSDTTATEGAPPTSAPDARHPNRRAVLGGTLGATGVALLGRPAPAAVAASAADRKRIAYRGWKGAQFSQGLLNGVVLTGAGIVMRSSIGQRVYADPGGSTRRYDVATWTSPVTTAPFPFSQAITSWNVDTPNGTWVEVRVLVVTGTTGSGWLAVGRWASNDPAMGGAIRRRSIAGQVTPIARVDVDTVKATRGPLGQYAVQILFYRPAGSTVAGPTVRLAGIVVSDAPTGVAVPVSAPGVGRGITLAVPGLSQEVHRGHYPEWDSGGEAWCSATSMAMVIQYWGTGPTGADIAWVNPSYDGHVDYAARMVYDYDYQGCGNWPFNVAYAARFGLEAFVTRLRSLAEAELFVKAGIPVIVSVTFSRAELPSAGYATSGHVMVICGFTAAGDVIVNDPASHLIADDRQVRTTFPRAQFENVWIPKSGGTAYIVRRTSTPLPAPPTDANWPSA